MPTRLATLALLFFACTPDGPSPAGGAAPAPSSSPSTTATSSSAVAGRLKLPGVSIAVPAEYVSLEPDRVERLRSAALRESPTATVEIVGAHDPAGLMAGMVYIQRSDLLRDPGAPALTVRETLEGMRDDLQARLVGPGLELQRFDFTLADDALAGCSHIRMTQNDRTMEVHSCMRFIVPAPDRLRAWTVQCMADTGRIGDCAPIIASREFTPGSALGFDTLLPAGAAR